MQRADSLAPLDPVPLWLEEYRCLYGLVNTRTAALDQRGVLAWGALLAFWAGFATLSMTAQLGLLFGVPLLATLLVHSTISHARSFEDVLRRIDQIERAINDHAGSDILVFQSRHPSRGRAVGGRTGREAVRSMFAVGAILLVSCLFIGHGIDAPPGWYISYAAYVFLQLVVMLIALSRWSRYRYSTSRSGTAAK